jgi:hypothetical protein
MNGATRHHPVSPNSRSTSEPAKPRPAPKVFRRILGPNARVAILLVSLFPASGAPAIADTAPPPEPPPVVNDDSRIVPEPAAPWLALVFAVGLILLRNRTRR